MESSSADRNGKSGRGCVVAAGGAVVVLAALLVAINLQRQRVVREFERKQAELRREFVEKVRSGNDGSGIFIFDDARLIAMLAADSECVANLRRLQISMADLSGTETAAAGKLRNVRSISLYSTDADALLAAMQGMPSVEDVHFEGCNMSNTGVRLLATFPNLKRVRFGHVVDEQQERLIRETLLGVNVEIPFPAAMEPGRQPNG